MSFTKKDPESRNRKFQVVALLLPALGLLLILPPLVSMRSDSSAMFFGVPANIAYLFSVWLFLILGAYFLQKNIPDWSKTPTNTKETTDD